MTTTAGLDESRPAPAPQHRHSELDRRRATSGRWFVAPNLLAVALFSLFPLGFSLYLSCQHWTMFGPMRFAGAANFRRLLTADPLLPIALRNTVVFTLGTLLPTLAISLVLAVLLSPKIRGVGIFRTIMFLPLAVSSVVMAVVWRFVFDSNNGVLDIMLGWFGIRPIPWLIDPQWAMLSLCLVSIWKNVPFATVVLLAAVQGVSEDLYEAAKLDGAGALARFFAITLPHIRGAVSFVVVISVINAVQAFDLVYVLAGNGGPETATYVLGIMIFQNAFSFADASYAAAIAWLVFLALLLMTGLHLWLTNRRTRQVI